MEDKNKKYDFQIAKINQKLRELKEFELFLLILKIDEKNIIYQLIPIEFTLTL